jgi:hypothetical protein
MLNWLATIAVFSCLVALVYVLGIFEGRHLEKRRTRARHRKTEWMLREALRRWSPWTEDETEWLARLSAEYEEDHA